jgi:asparagine synthase (glutamine-hydrolysing)
MDAPPATPSGFPLLTTRDERRLLVGAAADAEDAWEQEVLTWLQQADNDLQRATAAEIATWLPSDLLVKFDRMAMAHSLEGRAPFLDPRVVALGLGLPPEDRMGRESKVALRRIARRLLPDAILQRPKQGFVLPMRRWLGEWFAATGGAESYIAARPIPGLDGARLADLVSADLRGGIHRERLLFAVVMLMEWWHHFAPQRNALRQTFKTPQPA